MISRNMSQSAQPSPLGVAGKALSVWLASMDRSHVLFEPADPHATVLPRCVAVLSMAAAGDMHCGSPTAVLGEICCGDVFPGAASFCKPSSELPNPKSDSLKDSNWTVSADPVAEDVCRTVGGMGELSPTLVSAYHCVVSSTVSEHSGRQSDSICYPVDSLCVRLQDITPYTLPLSKFRKPMKLLEIIRSFQVWKMW